ncbi:MAG: hypothetical protein KY476_19610, partial [Planctomycetes bacterium]|nr:hypothetical protein [Planctomycetota bacterium]
MHKLGIAFLFLIVPAAVVAMLLTAKMFHVRNSWLQRVERVEQQVEQNEPLLVDKRRELRERQGELQRVLTGWDRYANNVQTVPGQVAPVQFPNDAQRTRLVGFIAANDLNALAAGLTNPGQPLPPQLPEVYVFGGAPGGPSTYWGSFTGALQGQQYAFATTSPLRGL